MRSLECFLKEVCEDYSIKEEGVGLPGKDRRISEARGMAAWLINLKLGSEAAADTGKQGFKVGREDEGIIQSSFLKLQYCKPQSSFPGGWAAGVAMRGRTS